MTNLQQLTNELDQVLASTHEEYVELHNRLDAHRGKPIEETNLAEVNQLLKDIQEKFADMYNTYNFITHRHEHAINAINTYNEFIDVLKKAGATKQEDIAAQ